MISARDRSTTARRSAGAVHVASSPSPSCAGTRCERCSRSCVSSPRASAAVVVDDLAESRRQLEESQALAHIGSWTWDRGTDTVSFSDEQYRLYGLEPQCRHVDLDTFLALIHPEDRGAMRSAVGRAFRTGAPFAVEHRLAETSEASGGSRGAAKSGSPTARSFGWSVRARTSPSASVRAGAARQLGRGPCVAGTDRRGRGRRAPPGRARPARRRAAAPRDVDDGAARREGPPGSDADPACWRSWTN